MASCALPRTGSQFCYHKERSEHHERHKACLQRLQLSLPPCLPKTLANPQKKRICYIDIAKGFAMLCIIAGHFGIASANRFVYTFHVPLFFLLSGYFLSTKTDFLPSMKQKARQLLVPYYITGIVSLQSPLSSITLSGQKSTLCKTQKASLVLYSMAQEHPILIPLQLDKSGCSGSFGPYSSRLPSTVLR